MDGDAKYVVRVLCCVETPSPAKTSLSSAGDQSLQPCTSTFGIAQARRQRGVGVLAFRRRRVLCALVAAATLRCGVSGSGGARRFCLFCWWVRPPWLSSCLRARAFCWFPPFSVRLSLEAQLLMPPAAISCAVDASQHHIDWCNCFGRFGSGSTHTASLNGSVGPFKGT